MNWACTYYWSGGLSEEFQQICEAVQSVKTVIRIERWGEKRHGGIINNEEKEGCPKS
jgi:hypothetical protein